MFKAGARLLQEYVNEWVKVLIKIPRSWLNKAGTVDILTHLRQLSFITVSLPYSFVNKNAKNKSLVLL